MIHKIDTTLKSGGVSAPSFLGVPNPIQATRRYRHLLALPILNIRELDELSDLMERLDPERFNREVAAWETEHGF